MHKCCVGVREYECPGFDLSPSKEGSKVVKAKREGLYWFSKE